MNKILLISSNSSGRGGGELYLKYLSEGFLKNGDEVHILYSTSSFLDEIISLIDPKVNILRTRLKNLNSRKLRFISAIFDLPQIFKIYKVCTNLKPDKIIVNQQYDEDGLDYLLGSYLYSRHKTIGVIHMPMSILKKNRPFYYIRKFILKLFYSAIDYKKVFVSEGCKNEFQVCYNIFNNCKVIHNSLNKLPPIKEERNRPIKTIGFIGQLVPQKNILFLISVFKELIYRDNEVELLIIGDGYQRNVVEKELSNIHPSKWRITGWLNNPEKEIQKIDLLVMPSLYEGLPFALVETSIRGIPCLVSNFHGAIDVQCYAPWVKIVSKLNVELFRKEIDTLLDQVQKWDSKFIEEKIKLMSSHFSINRVIQKFYEI